MSAPFNTLSPIEQKETIHASVSAAVKQILMFSDQETLPLNQSFFELGLSSLTLQKLKQQLQQQFDLEINMVELFNQPTVEGKDLSSDQLIQKMIEFPKLIERPIVLSNKQARVGRPPESVLEIL